jgi:ribosomal protein S18 acetylase RimI-like enzyme
MATHDAESTRIDRADGARDGDVAIELHDELDAAALDTLVALDLEIFAPHPFSRERLERELRGRRDLSILFAVRAGSSGAREVCGYKVGYQLSAEVYCSFVGGVHAAHRGQGIASRLMAEQHRFARQRGYRIVRTHTRSEYRSMLLLNIKSGFDVTGVNHKSGDAHLSIILEKVIADPR